jgi:Cu/Ag efflux protein CusF
MKQQPLSLIVATLLGALSMPVSAQKPPGATETMAKETSPGKGTVTRTRRVVATVEGVDAEKGFLTLKGPENRVLMLAVGPEVRNLPQVKVGDRVIARYDEALSLSLKKDGKELRSSTESAEAVQAPAGTRPGGAVAGQVTVTADVIGVDRKTQKVRLRGPKQTVDLYVEDPKQLKLVKVGDQVEAVYRQAMAVSVEPAEAAKK